MDNRTPNSGVDQDPAEVANASPAARTGVMGGRRPLRLAVVHGGLLLASFATMMLAPSWGALFSDEVDFWPLFLGDGLLYAVTLAAILGTHEMGHYLAARFHGMNVSLPYFLPAPPPMILGTFGAFIRIRDAIPSRKALLDVGVAGPLSGFVVAVVALVIGLSLSPVAPVEEFGLYEGNSLLYLLLKRVVVGPVPAGSDVFLHPVAWAGWIGLLVTALNLFPVGQLDGGHVVYALFGERMHGWLGRITFGAVLGLSAALYLWDGLPVWFAWIILMLVVGFRHPRPKEPQDALGPVRRKLGWLCLVIFLISVPPIPLSTEPGWSMPWSSTGGAGEAALSADGESDSAPPQ